MLTTIEEDVLELWTRTVTSTPMTKPATGLDSTTLSLKMSPAILPVAHREMQRGCRELTSPPHPGLPPGHSLPSSWKAELRMSREQMKK